MVVVRVVEWFGRARRLWLGVLLLLPAALWVGRLGSQEVVSVDARPLVRAEIAEPPPPLSQAEAERGVLERVARLHQRYAAQRARRRQTPARNYMVADAPPQVARPPRPDAAGGELARARSGAPQ
ncbi:MAG: hypothetical protein HY699_03760 [Deltaproteobacteria bacterium]|nr:hypothetical protein [Deltaproteobacteria bacterium]